jgi:hypothetical protein
MGDRSELKWTRNRGRDGWSSLLDIDDDKSAESLNVHLFNCGLGTKRGGSVSITTTGVTHPLYQTFEFVPGQGLQASELFLVDSSAPNKILRCAGGSSFTNLTLKDNIADSAWEMSAVGFNGKLYIAYKSAANRLHVFDPLYSTTEVRRAGMGITAAPTVANTGGGAYAATLRYYRVRFAEIRSGVTIREGPPSPAQSFTPSGAGTAARVTKPASLSEGETHWILEGSADGVTYYDLATTVVGTTTYDDTAAPSAYASGTASPVAGARTPFPSVKCVGTDGTRLYGFGVWETTAGDSLAPKPGRFYFGPVLDSTATNDDERINNTTTLKGYIDLARNSGAVDRGCTPRPVNNVIYAFQSFGVYGLIPTESPTTPYRRVVLSSEIGNNDPHAIVMATDRSGQACCFFVDQTRGPYVVGGVDGLKWCGKDVADVWATLNKDATVRTVGLWYPDLFQVIFFIATGANTTPTKALVLDVTEMERDEDGDLRGGWTVYDGDFCSTACATLFSNTLNATRSSTRVPYTGGNNKLLRYDESVNRDDTSSFQSYVTSGARAVDSHTLTVENAYLASSAQSGGVVIQQSLIRNTGDETVRTSTVDLAPVGSETTVLKKFEDTALQDAWMFQVKLGDSAAANVAWQLFQHLCKVRAGAPR